MATKFVLSPRRTVRRAVSVLAVLLSLYSALSSSAQATALEPLRVALATRSVPALPGLTDTGALPVSQRLSLTLTLAPTADRTAALDSFLVALSTPGSGSYHQWMTPAQFAVSFGATADQLAAATTWARAQGFNVDAVSPSSMRLAVSGTVAQVQTAFATSLHSFQSGTAAYFGNVDEPSLPAEDASLIAGVDGLSTVPSTASITVSAYAPVAGAAAPGAGSTPPLNSFSGLSGLVDANATPYLALSSTACASSLSTSELAEYTAVLRQAAAQGISTFSANACTTGAYPSALAEVTALNVTGSAVADSGAPLEARPGWQSAPGLPADNFRHIPDLTVSSLTDFTSTLATIAGSSRLGNVNPVLYELAPEPGLYSQPDVAAAGTWEAATGLGLVDLHTLAKVYPRGTGMSYTSFQATNYSPVHGQGTSFTSTVTSGTGGATPTGTVSFVTSAGVTLGTATLVSGTGSITLTNLNGGNLTVYAQYSGDGTYAASQSPTAQLYVQPEPSALSASVTGAPTIGASYTLTVTDSAPSGVGQPTGPISVTISGTSNTYSASLVPAGTASSTATFSIPATTVGTITLSITCTATANYSCYNPYTTTVTIVKATPALSISYTPNPPVSGATIALNAVVSTVGSAPAPTGAVTFFDSGTTLNAGQLSNGATSTTGTVPTTSTHSITATYAGDANYNSVSTTSGSSTSGTITTSLALISSSSAVTSGQAITFTATLTAASTGPASPTGTVSFLDNGVQIGTSNLVNGTTASFSTSALAATSNHSITAVYSGDGYYSASSSSPVSLVPSASSKTAAVTLTASSTTVVHGQSVTITATAAAPAGGAVPTGTISFYSAQSGTLGQVALSNGVAVFITNQLPGGVSSITANYSGSTAYNPASSAALTETVTPEPAQLSISVPATPTFGQSLAITVAVTGASGVSYPTGVVSVTPTGSGYSGTDTGILIPGGVTSSSSGVVTVQAVAAGVITLSASYRGDENFAASGPITVTVNIAKAYTTTHVAITQSSGPGQSATLTAKVRSTAAGVALSGTVQFNDLTAGTVLGTVTLAYNAQLVIVLPAANHVLDAVYSGDSNYYPSTSASIETVTGTVPTTTTITPSSAVTATVNQPVSLAATVAVTTGTGMPTGSVQFIAGGTLLCTAQLSAAAGSCSYTPTAAVTALPLEATYSGDPTYAASTSVDVALTVGPGAGSLAATISPASAVGGSVATVTAVVTAPAGNIPTGSITATVVPRAGGTTVSSNTVAIPTGTSNAASVQVPVTIPATAGLYTVVVSCLNTNFTCTNVSLNLASITTGAITTTTVLTAVASSTTTGVATLTATITPATVSTALPTGSVIFYDGTVPIAIGTVASDVATATVTLSTTTTHSLTAVYSGDTIYAGSTSAAVTSIGTSTGTTVPTVVLTSNVSASLAGGSVVLTAKVAGLTSNGAAPTGSVSFFTGGSTARLLGTATLGVTGSGSATAVLATNSIPDGAQSVYAVYAGDTTFSTATSNSVAIGITDFGLQLNPATLTLTQGATGTATVQVAVVNGFTGTVSLSCVPPGGAEITCAFASSALTPGSSTVLTVTTTKQVRVSQARAGGKDAGFGVAGGIALAALLCFPLPGRRRRTSLLLIGLLALGLSLNLGCAASNGAFGTEPVSDPGTPLGTTLLTISATSTDGVNYVRHTYTYQVTVQ